MKIIAFSGKKQSGKTTAVDDIKRRLKSSMDIRQVLYTEEYGFADRLKLFVLILFVPIEWGWRLFDIDKHKDKILPCGMTVRQALQWLGTDICRAKDPDCWVRAYKRQLKKEPEACFVLTPDVRFPNEVKCIQDLGGHVIRLLRAPFPDDKHESETALDMMVLETMAACKQNEESPIKQMTKEKDKLYFDAIIDNREMSIAEQNEAVWKLVKERKWI